ncbi:hypothetical protein JCM6882_007499 [Rhodosporidiobolus microsporus]
MSTRTISLIGATGAQGSGAVAALLAKDPSFVVRAISSNPSGERAQVLINKHREAVDAGRLTVVKGDLNDQASLEDALKGSEGVFAAFPDSLEQVEQGKKLVDAAKAVNIQHFVYSTLPSVKEITGGKYTQVHIFDHKVQVAEYAKQQLDTVTFIVAGAFYTNLSDAFYVKREDGIVKFVVPFDPAGKYQWVDERYDNGVFVAAIFSAPRSVTKGKTYPVMGQPLTMAEFAAEYEAATGEKAVAAPADLDEALKVMPPAWLGMMREMHLFLNEMPPEKFCYGSMSPEEDTSFQDLGVKASTLTEYIQRTGFKVAA